MKFVFFTLVVSLFSAHAQAAGPNHCLRKVTKQTFPEAVIPKTNLVVVPACMDDLSESQCSEVGGKFHSTSLALSCDSLKERVEKSSAFAKSDDHRKDVAVSIAQAYAENVPSEATWSAISLSKSGNGQTVVKLHFTYQSEENGYMNCPFQVIFSRGAATVEAGSCAG